MSARAPGSDRAEAWPDAVHGWFGLSYCSHVVLPRVLLQSMPDEWQERFVILMRELEAAFGHVRQPSSYKVEAAEERELSGLSAAQLTAQGITRREIPCSSAHDHEKDGGWDCDDGVLYDSDEREGMTGDEMVLVPVADPLPHYDRGRARVEPDLEAIAARRAFREPR